MLKKSVLLTFLALIPLLFPACSSDPGEPILYERIVIGVHKAGGVGAPTDIDIALYLDDGSTELARDDTSVDPGLIDTETEGLGLQSGTYRLEVYHEKPLLEQEPQAYAVRAISLALGEAIPVIDNVDLTNNVPTTIPTINFVDPDPYEIAFETYSSTIAVLELDTNWVQRYLTDDGDIDWIKIVLP